MVRLSSRVLTLASLMFVTDFAPSAAVAGETWSHDPKG